MQTSLLFSKKLVCTVVRNLHQPSVIVETVWHHPCQFSGLVGHWQSLSSLLKMAFQPVVLSGPSGSGKSTLLKRLMDEFPGCFAFSVSHTTRKPRPGEEEGVHYHFIARDEMEKKITNSEFVESAEFSGNLYGTSKQAIRDIQDSGRICILDVDMQGVKSIKNTDLNPRYLFIKPPSLDVLEQRLRGRGTETEDAIQKRLSRVQAELDYGAVPNSYDHVIVNDNLDVAYGQLKNVLIKEIEECQAYKKKFPQQEADI